MASSSAVGNAYTILLIEIVGALEVVNGLG